MKTLILTSLFAITSHSSFAQTTVTAEKTNTDVDLCFYKQIQLQGYAYANIVGNCAWDPALNGMQLSIVAVIDQNQANKIDLANIRDVEVVENKSKQAQISIVQDYADKNGEAYEVRKVIYVRSLNSAKGTFSVVIK